MSRFVWTLFPGGKMKNATYSNWLPGEPDFGQRVVGKISYTEAFVEMVYSPDKTETLAAEWNDRYCYVKKLCSLRAETLRVTLTVCNNHMHLTLLLNCARSNDCMIKHLLQNCSPCAGFIK